LYLEVSRSGIALARQCGERDTRPHEENIPRAQSPEPANPAAKHHRAKTSSKRPGQRYGDAGSCRDEGARGDRRGEAQRDRARVG
jgi:hypothetical protein